MHMTLQPAVVSRTMPTRMGGPLKGVLALMFLLATTAAPTVAQQSDRSLDAGPGWLIEGVSDLSDGEYQQRVEELLADGVIGRAIKTRQRLYRDRYLTPLDDRSRTVFLRGEPEEITLVECGFVFQPLEIWRYADDEPALIFHRDDTGLYRVWLPTDGKPMLYSDEMRYYMEQWEEFKSRISGKRFDKRTCEAWKAVDDASGVDGLYDVKKDRPTDEDILAMLEPPADVQAWAGAIDEAAPSPDLEGASLRLYFPELRRQRMETLFIVDLPLDAGVEPTVEPDDVEAALGPGAGTEASDGGQGGVTTEAVADDSEPGPTPRPAVDPAEQNEEQAVEAATIPPSQVIDPELRVVVEGLIEQDGAVFERFRFRFRHPVGKVDERLNDNPGMSLSFREPLRPGTQFVARLRVEDPTSGRRAYLERSFEVPRLPVAPPADERIQIADRASAETFAATSLTAQQPDGGSQLYLVPPAEEVVFGVLRTEAVVVGEVKEVRFLVDGQQQFTRTRPPYTADLNLSDVPRQQVIRAEAYDADGELLAADELVVNQPQGVFSVRILDPAPRHARPGQQNTVRAEVTLPPERRLEKVEFALDDEVFATRTSPPWEAEFTAPPQGVVAYLAVTATLTTGARVEDVLFLNAPQILEEVDVQLVELLTTVVDGNGRPVTGVTAEDFEIYDNGRLQTLQKFEVVENLPLVLGFALDTSSSMKNALPEAKNAVLGFLDNTVRPQDRVFSIAFSHETRVLTPPTDDFDLVRRTLTDLVSYGGTALHDALVTSLFFARGFEGRKVLVLLSDGEDTASRIDFDTAMHYAQASGTVIYTVGLKITDGTFRRQLERLATETGGRAFTISKASDLEGVYQEIADELRKQVLLAYAPAPPGELGEFHEVEVKVKGRGLEARTIGGYVR